MLKEIKLTEEERYLIARKRAKINQMELSKVLGITHNAISMIERGKYNGQQKVEEYKQYIAKKYNEMF